MSIATLKKKSKVQYRNLSVGQPHFSLNGTHRSQGYVGQTSLSRSLPRTLMNGAFPRGNGGCCGSFPIKPIVQSAVTSVENPNVIKLSVISSKGMLEEKSKCITSINTPGIKAKLPTSNKFNNIVKPNNNNNLNNQSSYIKRITKMAIQNTNKCSELIKARNDALAKDENLAPTPVYNCSKVDNKCTITKAQSDFVPISQGEYLLQLNNRCVNEDVINPVPPIKKTPFACH